MVCQPSAHHDATASTGPLILVLVLCQWVDDIWLTGRRKLKDQLDSEFYVQLDRRFDTSGVTWLLTGVTIDHVTVGIHAGASVRFQTTLASGFSWAPTL
jgi:hypothetical protein